MTAPKRIRLITVDAAALSRAFWAWAQRQHAASKNPRNRRDRGWLYGFARGLEAASNHVRRMQGKRRREDRIARAAAELAVHLAQAGWSGTALALVRGTIDPAAAVERFRREGASDRAVDEAERLLALVPKEAEDP